MTVNERGTMIGLGVGLVAFIGYWVVVIYRSINDSVPFTQVAWQGPMLLAIAVGGGVYAIAYGVLYWRTRGQRRHDERDDEIHRYAETAGAGLAGMGGLIAIILLALDVDTFWPAHALFVLGYLGSLINASVTIAGYREGVQA